MRNKLDFGNNIIIEDSNLLGGVNFNHCVNADTDLTVGTVSSAEVNFTYGEGSVSYNWTKKTLKPTETSGSTVLYYNHSSSSPLTVYFMTNIQLVLYSGSQYYVRPLGEVTTRTFNNLSQLQFYTDPQRTNYWSVDDPTTGWATIFHGNTYNGSTNVWSDYSTSRFRLTYTSNSTDSPTRGFYTNTTTVSSNDRSAYPDAGSDLVDFWSVYTYSGESSSTPSINKGDVFDYYTEQRADSGYRLVGKFIVDSITKHRTQFTITAYDYVSKFDKDVKAWNDALNWENGITVGSYFSQLCTQVGCTAYSTSFTNNGISMTSNPFYGMSLNANTLLGYIASCAGGYAIARTDGQIQIKDFYNLSTALAIDNTKYVSYDLADYTAPAITKVRIAISDSDVGVVVGSGDSVLNMDYNPIIYQGTTSAMTSYITNIYNKVSTYSYTPCTIEMLEDYSVNVGDKITLNGVSSYVFSKSWTTSGVTFNSTGNSTRDLYEGTNDAEIQALNGKYTSIQTTVDGIEIEVGSIDRQVQQNTTDISINSQAISTKVSAGDIASSINQTAQSVLIDASKIDCSVCSYRRKQN